MLSKDLDQFPRLHLFSGVVVQNLSPSLLYFGKNLPFISFARGGAKDTDSSQSISDPSYRLQRCCNFTNA